MDVDLAGLIRSSHSGRSPGRTLLGDKDYQDDQACHCNEREDGDEGDVPVPGGVVFRSLGGGGSGWSWRRGVSASLVELGIVDKVGIVGRGAGEAVGLEGEAASRSIPGL